MAKYELVGIDELTKQCEDIKKILEQLTTIAGTMSHNDMEEAYFPWTKSTWQSLGRIKDLPNLMENALRKQIEAKDAGDDNPFEEVKAKSRKDVARRKKK